jgi:hypothetical protein
MTSMSMQPGANLLLSSLRAATDLQGREATDAWSRQCDRYARYMNALIHARENGQVVRAHVDFLQGGLEDFGAAIWRLLHTSRSYGFAAAFEGLDETAAAKPHPVSKAGSAKAAPTRGGKSS